MKITYVKTLILQEFEVGATYDIHVQVPSTGWEKDIVDVVVKMVNDDYIRVQHPTGLFENVYWFNIDYFTYKGVNSGVVH